MDKIIKELIEVKKQQAVTTSVKVAKHFGKRHEKILTKIDRLLDDSLTQNEVQDSTQISIIDDIIDLTISLEEVKNMFFESSYKGKDGKEHRMYFMNKDGFSLLVMGFTGRRALQWKLNYIKAFDKMISLLMERNTIEWQKTRAIGKETRHELTDALKKLEEYNKSQGSKNSSMVYTNYSKLINNIIGISERNLATTKQLHAIAIIEDMLVKLITEAIEENTPREHIYPKCKEQLLKFKKIALL